MRQNIYDNESFAMQYDKMRKEQKGYNANDLIEIPNFRNLIPNVKGKRVLDLGCGYGENSRYCIENGALYVLGIDISNAFHYIKDFKKLMKDIYNLLDENGTLVFSIDHPLRIASIFEPWMEKNYIELNGKWFLLVSDYSRNGLREKKWNGEIVKKYHRNFSKLINNITDSGLKIDKLLEPLPTEEMIQKVPKYIHQIDRPFFLFVKAVK